MLPTRHTMTKKPEIKKKYVSSEMVGHHIKATFQIYYYI